MHNLKHIIIQLFVCLFICLAVASPNKVTKDLGDSSQFQIQFPQNWYSAANMFKSDFVSLSSLEKNSGVLIVKHLKKPHNEKDSEKTNSPTLGPQKFLNQQVKSEEEMGSFDLYQVLKSDTQGVLDSEDNKSAFSEISYFKKNKNFSEIKYIKVIGDNEYIYLSFRAPREKYAEYRPLVIESIRSLRIKSLRR